MTIVDTPADLPGFRPELAAAYLRDGLWGPRTVGEQLRHSAAEHAERPALITPEVRLSYRELDELTDRFAAGLLSATSLRPGDRLVFSSGNVAETVVAYYGAVKAGIVPVCTLPSTATARSACWPSTPGPAGTSSRPTSAAGPCPSAAAPASGSNVVVALRGRIDGAVSYEELLATGATDEARAALARVEVDPDAVAAFQLSGGTTGLPKVAPRRHREYVHNSAAFVGPLGIDAGSVVLHALPIMHNAGIAAAMQPAHWAGAAFVLAPAADPVDDGRRRSRGKRVTCIPLVPPAVVIRLLDHAAATGRDLRGCARCWSAARSRPRRWPCASSRS